MTLFAILYAILYAFNPLTAFTILVVFLATVAGITILINNLKTK